MPTFSELDDLYKTTISKLPIVDRISYCNQRLDKVQYILEKNKDILDDDQKTRLRQMIRAAQNEVRKINDG